MKRPFLTAILMLLAAVACVPDIDPEYVDNGFKETPPDRDGMVTLSIGMESNLSEFVDVSFSALALDGKGRYGDFSNYPSFSWPVHPREGSIKVSFKAEQKKDFPKSLEGIPEKVTFKVWANVQTPTGGRKIIWGGLDGVEADSVDILNYYTVKAVNNGLLGQPKGTADKYYVQFDISLDSKGGYSIKPKWVRGTLFND